MCGETHTDSFQVTRLFMGKFTQLLSKLSYYFLRTFHKMLSTPAQSDYHTDQCCSDTLQSHYFCIISFSLFCVIILCLFSVILCILSCISRQIITCQKAKEWFESSQCMTTAICQPKHISQTLKVREKIHGECNVTDKPA